MLRVDEATYIHTYQQIFVASQVIFITVSPEDQLDVNISSDLFDFGLYLKLSLENHIWSSRIIKLYSKSHRKVIFTYEINTRMIISILINIFIIYLHAKSRPCPVWQVRETCPRTHAQMFRVNSNFCIPEDLNVVMPALGIFF